MSAGEVGSSVLNSGTVGLDVSNGDRTPLDCVAR